jgi:hypothetical protein
MGYGIINTQGGAVALSVDYSSGAGEWTTMYSYVPNFFPTNDIAVTTALNCYVCGQAGSYDGAAVGIRSYVDGGQNYDEGTDPGAWPIFLSTSSTTQVRLGYYLSGNGSAMRASWQITYWGDDADRSADRSIRPEADVARVVYDQSSGSVRHLELRWRTPAGSESADYADDPVADARELGHAGSLAVLEVSPAELSTVGILRVDADAGRLVRQPMPVRGGGGPA